MAEDAFNVGTLVENATAPQWGRGKILARGKDESNGAWVEVQFRDGVARKVYLRFGNLAVSAVQNDAALDRVGRARGAGSKPTAPPRPTRHSTQAEAVAFFQKCFPSGFADPKYLLQERDYKLAARQRFEEQFGGGKFDRLLSAGNAEALTNGVKAVLSGGGSKSF